jgi:outer membrane receptor for ferrienterochelin and colicins
MRWILVFLALGLAGPASGQTLFEVSGIVRDGETGEVLPGASVVLTFADEAGRPSNDRNPPARALGTAADLDGNFKMRAPGGLYRITVTFVGFDPHDAPLLLHEDTRLEIRLVPGSFRINPVTVTASRRPQKLLDSPASVTVLDARRLESSNALTAADLLTDAPSVDVIKTGLNSSRVVVRGFNDNLASSLLTLIDNRIARAPAIRLTAMQLVPIPNGDMDRIEILSGPASALYGPNAANGVVHVVTKSPFDAQGTTFSLAGGEQSLRMGSFRHAAVLSSKWAYKLTAQYYSGTEFEYSSPAEEEARMAALVAGASADTLRIGARDLGVNNLAFTGRVEGRLKPGLTLFLDGGISRGDNIEVTPTGAAQVKGARLGYVQARLQYKDLFVQAYGNLLNSGDSYFLRTGESFIDKSRLWVVQAQHFSRLGRRSRLTYGLDYFRTVPKNEGTVSGGYEDKDTSNETGAYLQSDTDLSARFALTMAGRADYHDRLGRVYFSPRAALVFKPRPQHNFRITYNRAFQTPKSNELFGDVLGARDVFGVSGLGTVFGLSGRTDLRAQGMFGGFHFSRGPGGLPQYRSPFSDSPGEYIDLNDPAMTARMWDIARFASVSGLADNLVSTGLIPAEAAAGISAALEAVLPRSLGGVLNQLKTLDLGSQNFVAVDGVDDLPTLSVTRTETLELGYKGLLGRSLIVGVDAYWSRIRDFVGPFFVGTPNVFLDAGTLNEALLGALPELLASSPDAAAALAALDAAPFFGGNNGTPVEEIAALVSTGVAGAIPFGTVSPVEAFDPTAVVLMRRSIGDISLYGVDLSVTQFLSKSLRIGGTYAWVSDDFFRAAGGATGVGVSDIALNAPRTKFGGFVAFDGAIWGGGVRLRGAAGFPVRSDVYIGETEPYTLVDLSASYRVRRDSRLILTVQNLLDRRHRQFVDVAEIGRLAVLRLELGL